MCPLGLWNSRLSTKNSGCSEKPLENCTWVKMELPVQRVSSAVAKWQRIFRWLPWTLGRTVGLQTQISERTLSEAISLSSKDFLYPYGSFPTSLFPPHPQRSFIYISQHNDLTTLLYKVETPWYSKGTVSCNYYWHSLLARHCFKGI